MPVRKPESLNQHEMDAELEKNLDSCIARLYNTDPNAPKLTQKQVHVGLEALIYKADHVSAKEGYQLQRAACVLEYKDKEGKQQIVSAEIKLNDSIKVKGIENEKSK